MYHNRAVTRLKPMRESLGHFSTCYTFSKTSGFVLVSRYGVTGRGMTYVGEPQILIMKKPTRYLVLQKKYENISEWYLHMGQGGNPKHHASSSTYVVSRRPVKTVAEAKTFGSGGGVGFRIMTAHQAQRTFAS